MVGGDGEAAGLGVVAELLEQGAVFRGREEGIVESVAPLAQLALYALGAERSSLPRQSRMMMILCGSTRYRIT